MPRPRTMTWLHRIGYVTTPLVAILLAAVLFSLGVGIWRGWVQQQQALDQPRPLVLDDEYQEFSRFLLAQLPPIAAIRPDGIRMLVEPSLTGRGYAIAVTQSNARADARGTLIVTTALGARTGQQRTDFVIPAEEYRQTMAGFDREMANVKRRREMMLDGVSVAFERVRGDSVVSGHGNDAYPKRLAALIYQLLRRHVSAPPLPDLADWQMSQASDCRARIAARASLNECPLPDAIWKALAAQPQP